MNVPGIGDIKLEGGGPTGAYAHNLRSEKGGTTPTLRSLWSSVDQIRTQRASSELKPAVWEVDRQRCFNEVQISPAWSDTVHRERTQGVIGPTKQNHSVARREVHAGEPVSDVAQAIGK